MPVNVFNIDNICTRYLWCNELWYVRCIFLAYMAYQRSSSLHWTLAYLAADIYFKIVIYILIIDKSLFKYCKHTSIWMKLLLLYESWVTTNSGWNKRLFTVVITKSSDLFGLLMEYHPIGNWEITIRGKTNEIWPGKSEILLENFPSYLTLIWLTNTAYMPSIILSM